MKKIWHVRKVKMDNYTIFVRAFVASAILTLIFSIIGMSRESFFQAKRKPS